ncbi:MAG: alanine dehydrogenase [Bilophila sp.]
MLVGIPTEIKNQEHRVGITPAGVHALVAAGHKVVVQKGAGLGSMITDEEYVAAGATILASAKDVWASEMVVKVKEPLKDEYELFHAGLILYTYLHLAPEPALTKAMLDKKVVGIAYETVQFDNGGLPLLAPMSEIAGRMSVQVGAQMLTKIEGGMGLLLGGTAGVHAANVVIVGAGTVGVSAAKIAMGMGAHVTVIDSNLARLRQLDDTFYNCRLQTLASNAFNIAGAVKEADLVIGSVLIPGALTPKLVTEEMVKTMKKGAAIVDVAIDQGGCIETTAKHGATYHDKPTFMQHGVVHYSVGNMPGAVARTSTYTLTNATMSYMVELANKGWKEACKADRALARGINTCDGKVYFKGVSDALGYPFHELSEIL